MAQVAPCDGHRLGARRRAHDRRRHRREHRLATADDARDRAPRSCSCCSCASCIAASRPPGAPAPTAAARRAPRVCGATSTTPGRAGRRWWCAASAHDRRDNTPVARGAGRRSPRRPPDAPQRRRRADRRRRPGRPADLRDARRLGYDGRVRLLCDERTHPMIARRCRRPSSPASAARDAVAAPGRAGTRARGRADCSARGHRRLGPDGAPRPPRRRCVPALPALVIATGSRPRRLPALPLGDAVRELRTIDDARALRDALSVRRRTPRDRGCRADRHGGRVLGDGARHRRDADRGCARPRSVERCRRRSDAGSPPCTPRAVSRSCSSGRSIASATTAPTSNLS